MELSLFSFLCFLILVSHSNAGFFSRRNVTRRMYYEALKDKSQDIKPKGFESLISSGDADELPQKLKELTDAANFQDVSATDAAADVPGGRSILKKESYRLLMNMESIMQGSKEADKCCTITVEGVSV
eukprot:TRINITY_DN13522_c0_g1_i1.p1 TRINITY_DN13522_c0_g1~~TRINITY_DN13522_c0_g1_i1.p1  ORF type:complete len:128 (-),score=19.20 TRINITY_DN13522_c0_g1_i1:8-391(-)